MTDQRKLEIATGLLKYILRERGVHLTQNTARELGNAAKAIGVPLAELQEFAKPLVQQLLDEQFGK